MTGLLLQRGGRQVRLTNVDKVLWPGDGYRKADLFEYLTRVAPFFLPHLKDRPLVTTRYPDGIDGKSFYHKNVAGLAPAGARTHVHWHQSSDREVAYLLAEDEVDLLWLGNMACLEIHPWLSRAGSPLHPDFAVFDFDPAPPAGFEQARQAALWLREVLDQLGLKSCPKTSGATGVHVYVPVDPVHTYEQVVKWVGAVAVNLCRLYPGQLTVERTVRKRQGVYVDYLQNGFGKTLAAPYSPRPRPGAPVSMPLTWDDLESADPREFTIKTVPGILEREGDPFLPVLSGGQRLTAGLRPGSPQGPGPGP